MWLPTVSIILPAYNCERYIAAAVTSILNQVYDQFELIVVNDGSADETLSILQSISDPRLRILNNDGNQGLIYTLNRAIDASAGDFIARMDADDIATNDRIEKQVHWLLHHPDTAVVGSCIKLIDAEGLPLPDWALDRQTTNATNIRKAMVKENCLAHPTVMVRSEILKKYRYNPLQKNIEDYDLWLRMLADGLIIDKIPQALLHYRDHQSSVTHQFLRNQNPFYKNFECKRRFLQARRQSGKWSPFERAVQRSMWRDRIMAFAKNLKQRF